MNQTICNSDSYRRFAELNDNYRLLIEEELDRLTRITDGGYPVLLDAMRYSLLSGGKRIRPCITLAVCDMLKGNVKNALPIACGIEMIHTYSLIHDDLPCMDNDDMRRGKPSNHKAYGEAMALLAGDGLLTFAFEHMLAEGQRIQKNGYYRAVYEVAKRSGISGMISGQAADIESNSVYDGDMLLYIDTHKTADMIAAAVLGGAYVAEADNETIAKLNEFSLQLGLLFQITDDILDFSGDQKSVGKTVGKDAEQNKLTYVTLYGLNGAKEFSENTAARCKKVLEGVNNSDYLLCLTESILHRRK